jgi:inosose dehydratase
VSTKATLNRRDFAKAVVIGAGAAAAPALLAAEPRKIKIGYTCLIWNVLPRTPENLGGALKDLSSLGFYKFETFAEVLESWDEKGELGNLITRYGVPLTSGYQTVNVTDPAKKKENLDMVTRLAKVIKKHNGTFMVLAANGVKRSEYNFEENRKNVVDSLNDYAKAANDAGLGCGFHQHTGTAIESKEETYTLMESADTKHLKFAPDVGQLQKGGVDALQVVKDFLPIVKHMHLKDFVGGQAFAGYCPLGHGKVDIAGILDTLEKANSEANIMVELDGSKDQPLTPLETAKISKAYLEKLGYKFRA